MPPLNRIRLSHFAAICSLPKETMRSMISQGRAPFRHPDRGDGQRTYDVDDLLAMMLLLTIARDGRRQDYTSEDIVRSGVVAEFFDRMEAGGSTADLLFLIPTNPDGPGFREIHYPFVATVGEVSKFLDFELGLSTTPYGPYGRSRDRIGLRSLLILPIWPVYKDLVSRARPEGFLIEGRHIAPIGHTGG